MRDHTKLRAFELADELVLLVYRFTSNFPLSERFGLTSQLRRAVISIPSNIVEGCARHFEGDFIRFLDIAHGSAREVEYQISIVYRLGFISGEDYQLISAKSVETSKVLNGLLRSLRR